MPKRIVLVEPQYSPYKFNYLPQGLLFIAAKLVENGFDVSIHDSGPLPECDVLGISATTPQYVSALRIAKSARAGVTVIGGAHATTSVAEAMNSPIVDLAVIGDGEDAFYDICRGVPPKNIPGVAYKSKGAVIVNRNVDVVYTQRNRRMPFIPYQLLDGKIGRHVNVCRNLEYSWNCGWHKKNRPKWWKTFSAEIALLMDLGVREVTITDDNFGGWSSRIDTTIQALDRLDSWRCRSSVNNIVHGQLDRKIRDSRCSEVEIDILSGSKRLLAEFGDHTVGDSERAIKAIEDVGIGVTIRAVIGLPGETYDSMIESLNWLTGRSVRLETLSPYPGTEFYEHHEQYAHFGFEITAIDVSAFDANNGTIPWKMETIDCRQFVSLRERMMEELR